MRENKILHAAVIGCGFIGSSFNENKNDDDIISHAAAYTKSDKYILSALCDVDGNRVARAAEIWGIKNIYTDAEEMLDAVRPELVSICTPDSNHEDLLEMILSKNYIRAIFCEKPIGRDVQRLEIIQHTSLDKKIPIYVNYSRRYSAVFKNIRNVISSGEFGNVELITSLYSKGVFHNGSHMLDMFEYLNGEIANIKPIHIMQDDNNKDDIKGDFYITFKNGSRAYMLNVNENNQSIFDVDILLDRGRIVVSALGNSAALYKIENNHKYPGYKVLLNRPETIAGDMKNCTLNAVEYIYRDLCSNTKSSDDSFNTSLKIIKQINEHIKNAVWS